MSVLARCARISPAAAAFSRASAIRPAFSVSDLSAVVSAALLGLSRVSVVCVHLAP